MSMGYAVAQLGARMHYAVPRALHAAGRLDRLFTDICAVSGWPQLLLAIPRFARPSRVRRLLARVPTGVPPSSITAFTAFGREYARRRHAAEGRGDDLGTFLWAGRRFCELIIAHGLSGARGVYAFNSAALELLQRARELGAAAVMEQTMAPHAFEQDVLVAERDRFPEWTSTVRQERGSAEFAAREAAEWKAANVIVCGSAFVRDTIAAKGGPIDRCIVVPYGVELPTTPVVREEHAGPLRVLVVGAVGLRKGSPYVIEAAARLCGRATIRMVGPVQATAAPTVERIARAVEIVGSVPRPEIADHLRWADVFLLPSLCEGSATSIYEAMACGLPVVCTPNAGSVVRDGIDGFIIPVRSTDAIVERLTTLADDRALRERMSAAAIASAQANSLAGYGARLLSALP